MNLKKGIIIYIIETGDYDLKFGGTETPTVESVISKLQEEVKINGKLFGPYLMNPGPNSHAWFPTRPEHKGWEIKVFKDSQMVEVKPSKHGNSLIIK